MNDALKEQVSAFVDDELRREETAMLVRRLAQEPKLGAQLGRYALIGETMRRSLPPVVATDLASRVSAQLDAEPALRAGSSFTRNALLRPLAGVAVAASVAAVAIVAWPTSQAPIAASGGEIATASPAPLSNGFQAASMTEERSREWDRLDPQIQQRLNGYLMNHSEHTPINRFGGMLNYVRITGQQNDE